MKHLFIKYKELIIYIIVGIITTLVNFTVYYVSTRIFNLSPYISNIIAWMIAVTFAFITNKLVVFKSMNKNTQTILKEGISFISMRLISLGFDMATMYIIISIMHWNDLIGKIISQVIVVILNYIFSKLYIFKPK